MLRDLVGKKPTKEGFVPFIKERNFMGLLLKEHTDCSKKVGEDKRLKYIENLKKTTKEYFFDKEYEKMSMKLKRIEESLKEKELNIDKEIEECKKALQKCPKGGCPESFIELQRQLQESISVKRQRNKSPILKSPLQQRNFSINKELFCGTRSSYLAEITECGLRFKEMLSAPKLDPWKKWYNKERVEIFPGKFIELRQLNKSIY